MSRSKRNGHARPPELSAVVENLIGALLADPDADARAGELREDDFEDGSARVIYRAYRRVRESGAIADAVLVAEELRRTGELDRVGGLQYLGSLAHETLSLANVRDHADVVRKDAFIRSLRPDQLRGLDVDQLREHISDALKRLQVQIENPRIQLETEPVSTWAARPEPAPRDWVWDRLIPARRPTMFSADGGLGKSTVGVQIGVHASLNRPLYGIGMNGGRVLGIFCEDELDEVNRRVRDVCAAEALELAQLDQFVAISREGQNNLLCTYDRDQIVFTPFYHELDATLASFAPRLLILDTLADVYGGDYLSTPHVRQFTKTLLGGLCVRHGCAILLVAHPSASGMASGDGGGFSTAWNNSVRSRLYMRRPSSGEKDDARDRRVLEVKKANYGPTDVSIPLIWRAGAFVPDGEPVDESPRRAPKVDTRLALAVMEYMRNRASSGSVVTFGPIFEHLQAIGELPNGAPETIRKKLQRTLKDLVTEGVLKASEVPRGYRLADSARDKLGTTSGQTRDTDALGTSGHSGHPFGEGGVPVPNIPNSCPERECPESGGRA